MAFKFPEKYRLRKGQFASDPAVDGNNGAAFVPCPGRPGQPPLKIIASDGWETPEGEQRWEHVSVSLPSRCPTWSEMCFVKSLFWDDEDAVMELHPPRSTWVNNHEFCLHLWRPVGIAIPLPPSILVGYKELGVVS